MTVCSRKLFLPDLADFFALLIPFHRTGSRKQDACRLFAGVVAPPRFTRKQPPHRGSSSTPNGPPDGKTGLIRRTVQPVGSGVNQIVTDFPERRTPCCLSPSPASSPPVMLSSCPQARAQRPVNSASSQRCFAPGESRSHQTLRPARPPSIRNSCSFRALGKKRESRSRRFR
jgi:hypothetical protein